MPASARPPAQALENALKESTENHFFANGNRGNQEKKGDALGIILGKNSNCDLLQLSLRGRGVSRKPLERQQSDYRQPGP